MSRSRGPEYRTTDRPVVHYHAEESWRARTSQSVAVDVAWRAAEPLTWPGTRCGQYARYYPPEDVLLICHRDVLLGVQPVDFHDGAVREVESRGLR